MQISNHDADESYAAFKTTPSCCWIKENKNRYFKKKQLSQVTQQCANCKN